MASKVKRDFEGPLKHLLVGTYDLRIKFEGRWVYLMVVLDAYSRAMLQLHTILTIANARLSGWQIR